MNTIVSIASHPTFVPVSSLAILDGVGQVHVIERSGQLRRVTWIEQTPVVNDSDDCVLAEEIITERDEWVSVFVLRPLTPEPDLAHHLLQSDFGEQSFACETDFKSLRARLVLVSHSESPISLEAFSNHGA